LSNEFKLFKADLFLFKEVLPSFWLFGRNFSLIFEAEKPLESLLELLEGSF